MEEVDFRHAFFFSSMLGNGFTRKKVGSLTLGEKLKKIRAEYQVNLLEVSRETGIRKEHLESLENGDYSKLPADVYVRGFLRSYAGFLGVDPGALIRLYERERSIAKHLGKETEVSSSVPNQNPKRFSLFVVTPAMMIGTVVALVFSGIVWYLYGEYRVFVSEPYLVILEPANGEAVNGDERTVVGKTDRDAKLFLNDKPALIDESGEFRERIRLQPGVNTLTVKVVNRFGKERSETVSIIAEYQVPENDLTLKESPENAETPLVPRLLLSVVEEKPVSILVRVGEVEAYRGELLPGEVKSFDCPQSCAVDSTSGKRTLAGWDGAEMKPISEKTGTVVKVVFEKKSE